MKQFLKFMFASLFGFLLGGLVLLFILLGIAGIMTSGSGDEEASIKEKGVLEVKLNYMIPERTSKSPFISLPVPGMDESKALGLNDIIANIKKAETDENIRGIYLEAEISPNDYATLEEIRNALIAFKKSGKFIYAYGEMMDEHSYYVATVADRIFLNPSGEILLNGFSQQVFYIKGLLDKMGLKPELIRHGKFKAAGEPLIADKMSDENRQQIESYVGSLYNHFLENIAGSRKKPLAEVKSIVNELKIQSAKDAVALKMIDVLKYKDEVDGEIKKKLSLGDSEKINFVSMNQFKRVKGKTSVSDNKIAVLYMVGDIVSGEGDEHSIGSDKMVAAIKKIREDDSYKALVLRINSPGGSALASDIIWREIILCKKKKPVVVSMGDVAASGGYFIAADADAIVAQPNTITGSIGVFGLLLNAQELLNNKLGIKIETVKFGEFSDLGTPDRPLTEAERKVIQNAVDRVYADFIQKVANGRKLTEAQVDEIAQGRVWSGAEAKKIGLVDELGGLDKAIAIAAKKAKLEDYRCVNLPELKDPLEDLILNLGDRASVQILKKELGPNYREYEEAKNVMKYQGIQTRMSYQLRID